jgi:hypothetical protein
LLPLVQRLLSAVSSMLAPFAVRRPLGRRSWCEDSCRLFRGPWRHSRCEDLFTAVLGAKTPVGCFADLGATRGAKTSLPPFLVRRLLSAISPSEWIICIHHKRGLLLRVNFVSKPFDRKVFPPTVPLRGLGLTQTSLSLAQRCLCDSKGSLPLPLGSFESDQC